MTQKIYLVIASSIVCVSTGFLLYQRGFCKGYEKGYKNASEVFSIKTSKSKTN